MALPRLFHKKPITTEMIDYVDNIQRVEPLPKSIGEQILSKVITAEIVRMLVPQMTNFHSGGIISKPIKPFIVGESRSEFIIRKPGR